MPNPLKTADLRAQGGYADTYTDDYTQDAIFIIPGKQGRYAKPSKEPFVIVSSYFQFANEPIDEDTAIWAAITTTWNNRYTYATLADLKDAMDTALANAGYTVLS